jgi:hypothetical protein
VIFYLFSIFHHGLSKLVFENKEMLGDYLRNRALSEIGDPAILVEKGGVGVEQQLHGVRQLCLTFIEDDPEIRPAMVDVIKELRRTERSFA